MYMRIFVCVCVPGVYVCIYVCICVGVFVSVYERKRDVGTLPLPCFRWYPNFSLFADALVPF